MDPPTNDYSEGESEDADMEVVAEAEEADAPTAAAAEDDDDDDDDDKSGADEALEEEVMADAVVVEEADDYEEDDDGYDDDNTDGANSGVGDANMMEVEDIAVSEADAAVDAVVVPEAAEVVAEAAPIATAVASAPTAVATAVPGSKAKGKSKSKTSKKKKKSATTPSVGKKSSSKSSTAVASKSATTSTKKKKKKASGSSSTTKSNIEDARWTRVAPARLDAAAQARQLLVDAVPTLPFVTSDIHVRSFGRLSIESFSDRGSKFSKANALYPVGYSCDRFEFSPIHGRVLKMRCSILDGRNIVAKQVQMGVPNPRTDLPDGPVFRIMWGQGIDEDVEQVAYPYDPYAMSPPLSSSGEVDAVAVPTSAPFNKSGGTAGPGLPRVGMRVKAVFDNNQIFQGTITRIATPDEAPSASSSKKKKRKKRTIEILYDDGSTESATYPDPDITLMSPEAEPEVDDQGNLEYEELKGLPVHTVIGLSPIEAWGKVLTKLGLADEFMSGAAMHAISASRQMLFQEAKGKIESRYQRKSTNNSAAITTNIPKKSESENGDVPAVATTTATTNGAEPMHSTEADKNETAPVEGDREQSAQPAVGSEAEKELRERVAELRKELEAAKAEGREAAVRLAEKRINALGIYLSNPFPDTAGSIPQQASWLALAVRKEKTKMGSTGNKKKVVTATDLLERNDTFFNAEIEVLLEGLPGSEYCSSYVFQSLRSGMANQNRAWVHEAQIRSQQEREKRVKASKDKKAKVSEERHREMKRKQLDDLRDERKRQKTEEEDEKKKARIEERITKLSVQVEERLFKEACFQREKAIVALAKTFTREYVRRRKAAELVAGQSIIDVKRQRGKSLTELLPLPKLSRVYDEDVLRVWDFMSSFGSFFEKKGYVKAIPSMNSLQSAINCLRDGNKDGGGMSKDQAIKSLTELAMALCKPLAASQTRLLFASLIALYPVLQKDFGAAFFNEINDINNIGEKDKDKEKREDSQITSAIEDLILPVNDMTWQEIARVQFLSDALGELGFSRQESAHLLRGYRSSGHPNSKESQRLRRMEDYPIALLRQALSDGTQKSKERPPIVVRIEAPTIPSCIPTDWMFYLHNVRYMKSVDIKFMIVNVKKSLDLLKASDDPDDDIVKNIAGCLEQLKKAENPENPKSTDVSAFKEVKQNILKLVDSRPGQDPPNRSMAVKTVNTRTGTAKEPVPPGLVTCSRRQHMGLVESLTLTKSELKKLIHAREEYMAEALKLKEELARQRRKENNENGDDDDDDDDDEDDEDDMDTSTGKVNGKAAIATPAEVAAAVVASEDNETSEKSEAMDVTSEVSGSSEKVKPESEQSNGSGEDAVAMDVDKTPNGIETKDAKTGAADSSSDTKVDSSGSPTESIDPSIPAKIGKITQYDDFCADIPSAPEFIRRCIAVIRSLALAGPSEPFNYPVDPQMNPGYYDMVLRPMCLWKAGKELQKAAERLSKAEVEGENIDIEAEVDQVVLDFGRNVRLIAHNCLAYSNAGPMIVSAGSEFLRIFERLLLDWVLAPTHLLTPLEMLDDDRCVEHHVSDEDSTVLLCDGCEGNFNISRLDPPLLKVPQGDWFCPRCVSGRWWGHLDPRLGKSVQRTIVTPEGEHSVLKGKVKQCSFLFPEGKDPKPSLVYEIKMGDGTTETWAVEKVDKSLKALGNPVARVRCIWALSESQGYGCQIPDKSLLRELVPVPLNPNISDAAAQAATSSTVFRDTIVASGTLMLTNPEDMNASEWMRLLLLLVMNCASCDVMQNLASKMESDAAEEMSKHLQSLGRARKISDVFRRIHDDDEAKKEGGEENEDSKEKADDEQTEDDPDAVGNEEDEDDEEYMEPMEDVEDDEVMEDAPKVSKKGDNGSATKKKDSPTAKPVNGKAEASTLEIEPSAVEVVNVTSAGQSSQGAEGTQEPKEIVVVDPVKERRSLALAQKSKRTKAREDSISAFTMKSQLRPAVASFSEDAVSHVIDTSLASNKPGLSFSSIRCRRDVCHFCGLTDVALGTPLVRVPDDDEWNEIIPHASLSRRVQQIACMQGKGIDDGGDDDDEDKNSGDGSLQEKKTPKAPIKMVSLTIRVADELVSVKEPPQVFDRTVDGGMLEFCPRNSDGFQNELSFRGRHDLPFVTGSLTAHECCAISVHKARKVHVVERFKEKQWELADANSGMSCGRTLAIGKDGIGRFYWKFHNEPDSLFVFVPPDANSDTGSWHRFSDPESIASVLSGLGRDDVVKDLHRAYPTAAKMYKEGTWSNEIWKRQFPNALVSREADADSDQDSASGISKEASKEEDGDDDEEEAPFEVNEKVLVESASGKLLWDATVTAVSRSPEEGPVTGYRVRYKGWSSRFDEWVDKDRLVEPSENNLQVQEEMLEEAAAKRDGLPPVLSNLEAHAFLRARDRARGNAYLPDFATVANAGTDASSDNQTFSTMKAALLLIEASLPVGAVDTTSKGSWRPDIAKQWRLMVERAGGPANLLRCVILLEDVITEEWFITDVGHTRACLPNRFLALSEASVSSLAIRIILLDRGLIYGKVDSNRFVEPKEKKKRPR